MIDTVEKKIEWQRFPELLYEEDAFDWLDIHDFCDAEAKLVIHEDAIVAEISKLNLKNDEFKNVVLKHLQVQRIFLTNSDISQNDDDLILEFLMGAEEVQNEAVLRFSLFGILVDIVHDNDEKEKIIGILENIIKRIKEGI